MEDHLPHLHDHGDSACLGAEVGRKGEGGGTERRGREEGGGRRSGRRGRGREGGLRHGCSLWAGLFGNRGGEGEGEKGEEGRWEDPELFLFICVRTQRERGREASEQPGWEVVRVGVLAFERIEKEKTPLSSFLSFALKSRNGDYFCEGGGMLRVRDVIRKPRFSPYTSVSM